MAEKKTSNKIATRRDSGKAPRMKIKYHPSQLPNIINAIYCYYDCDRSEFLKKTQFARVLTKLITDMGGEKPSLEDIEDIMYELDLNGDGQISKEEFQMLMEKVIEILGNDVREARFMGKSEKSA